MDSFNKEEVKTFFIKMMEAIRPFFRACGQLHFGRGDEASSLR
jgi:hypothetical protein